MKILLVGNGKMGQAFLRRLDDKVVGIITPEKSEIMDIPDIIIDFSNPKMLNKTLFYAHKYQTKLIVGTTGYNNEEMAQLRELSKEIAIVYSNNFSYGIAFIESIVEKKLINRYNAKISETHSSEKSDIPSGTALELATILNTSCIVSYRENDNCGIHKITLSNPYEEIEITHKAITRDAYVEGVCDLLDWIIKKDKGFYSFRDYVRVKNSENIFENE